MMVFSVVSCDERLPGRPLGDVFWPPGCERAQSWPLAAALMRIGVGLVCACQ